MKEHTYSVKICNLIKEFLSIDDWHYSFDDRRGTFQFGLNLTSKIKSIKYLVDVDEDSYIVYAYCPIGAEIDDTDMMHRMSDFICRVNYGLKNGDFEFDMRDGEIRYKTFVDCDGVLPSIEMIKTSIYCPAIMFERYGSGIVDIIFSGISAKLAIDKCEKKSQEEYRTMLESEKIATGEVSDILERLTAHFSDSEHQDSGNSEGETTV